MALESSLWNWLAKARKDSVVGPHLHMTRIENAAVAGMPDVEGHVTLPDATGQFWLELKSEARPKKPGTPIRYKIRDKQVEWLQRRWALGANAFWLLQLGEGSDRSLFVMKGDIGPRLAAGMIEAELAIEAIIFVKTITPAALVKRIVTCRSLPVFRTPR